MAKVVDYDKDLLLAKEEGLKAGLRIGLRDGGREGVREGKRETLLNLLQVKFGTTPQAAQEKVLMAEQEEIEAWLVNLILKSSLDDVLS
jgi:hypothetical protein